MKRKIVIAIIVVVIVVVIMFSAPPRPGPGGPDATATYGAEILSAQLTARASVMP